MFFINQKQGGINMSDKNNSANVNVDVYGDYSTTRVPEKSKRSFLSTFLVFNGIVICAAALWSGSALSDGLNLFDTLIACICGFGIAGILGGIMAIVGSREGVSMTMLSRNAFGRYGSVIIGLIFSITSWGWYAFQAGFFGTVINTMFPNYFLTQPEIASLWGGIIMIITAMIGYKGLAFLSFLSIPLMIVIIGAGDFAIFSEIGLQNLLAMEPANPISLGQGITIAAGGLIVGAILTPDTSRYSKKSSHGFWAFLISLMVVNIFIVLSGAAMTHASGSPNLPEAMVKSGLGIASLVMIILAQWTTNDNNLYSTTLALVNIIPIKKWILAVILGVSASIAAYMGVVNLFVPFLLFLGAYIPPIGGIVLAHYFLIMPIIHKKTGKIRYEFGKDTLYNGIDVLAMVLIVVSGFIATKIPGIVPINAIIIGFLGYFVLAFAFEKLGVKYKFGKVSEKNTGY